jgi:hypothetical protein
MELVERRQLFGREQLPFHSSIAQRPLDARDQLAMAIVFYDVDDFDHETIP